MPSTPSPSSKSGAMSALTRSAEAAGDGPAATTCHGRANIAVGSDTDNPMRFAPKSTPTIRTRLAYNRRALLATVLALLSSTACGRTAPAPFADHPKLVVLGFDGMDPVLLQKWMTAGQLPNLARVAHMGTFQPLGTTVSPESPTSWASFATGSNPGKHNIYDFLIRDVTM